MEIKKSCQALCGNLPKQFLFQMRLNFLSHLLKMEDLPQGDADQDLNSVEDLCVEMEAE